MFMSSGNIILLNGTSSAGKSTLVKAIQDSFEDPYLHAGIDEFMSMLPARYVDTPYKNEVFEYAYYMQGVTQQLRITAKPIGQNLLSGMQHAIVALAKAGNNVVADHVLLESERLYECARLFSKLPAYFVGVRCPLEVVEQREMSRQDRIMGEAKGQFNYVHAHGVYDIEVDTSILSPRECAMLIKDLIERGQSPSAFRKLFKREQRRRFHEKI